MTTTGPMPVIREPSTAERMASLAMMGAPVVTGMWRSYRTADAVIDTDRGVLFIACDLDPDPSDWAAVTGLICAVGFSNGQWPHGDDPGEPELDAPAGVYTFRLEYAERAN